MKRQLPIWVIVTSAVSWGSYLLLGFATLPIGFSGLSLVYSAGLIALWIRGIRQAGRGIPRFLLLSFLALSLSDLASTITPQGLSDFKRTFKEGYEAGYQGGYQPNSSESNPVRTPRNEKTRPHLRHHTPIEWLCLIASWSLFLLLLDRLARHQERQEAQRLSIESLSRKAQELSLRAKLAPHFIFNTLNTLKAQIEQDPGAAAATTDKLAMLFRQILEVSDVERIPLRQELSFVEAYLGIEQARLGDRLQVSIEIPEELETIEIPPLSLQVLVENAVKHGVAPLEAGGLVRISASIQEAHLVLEVDDPGDGKSTFQGTGTAINTLRQRLSEPYDLMWYPIPEGFRFAFRWPLNPELP
jgi:hypothetical protein